MCAEIKPTRSELMKLKKKIKLAVSGHKLLKKKRDGLILEFSEILKDAKTVRSELTEAYINAKKYLKIAHALEGVVMESTIMALKEHPTVEIENRNIMGVVVPKIESEKVVKHFPKRGYGLVRGSSSIDEAAFAYEKLLEKVIAAAEIENTMKRLLYEIEKTKRRVNALEFSVIPKTVADSKFITLRLEEMERENVFRLKKIKS
ncbi:MAG: V-type ATP synthase subunit D [Candidatus Diapherotrites archaeon]|nr:V-type ATP synthase subunit D [Candidatus Diapherotrites archaeon]